MIIVHPLPYVILLFLKSSFLETMQGRKEGHAHTLYAYTRAFPCQHASSSAFYAYPASHSHGAMLQHSWGRHVHSSPPKQTPSQDSGDHSYQLCTRAYQPPRKSNKHKHKNKEEAEGEGESEHDHTPLPPAVKPKWGRPRKEGESMHLSLFSPF